MLTLLSFQNSLIPRPYSWGKIILSVQWVPKVFAKPFQLDRTQALILTCAFVSNSWHFCCGAEVKTMTVILTFELQMKHLLYPSHLLCFPMDVQHSLKICWTSMQMFKWDHYFLFFFLISHFHFQISWVSWILHFGHLESKLSSKLNSFSEFKMISMKTGDQS